ncbi:MAG: hypothetical protein IKU27_05875 [Clostridia bacterium]|nr:hypothetical protein [Clostridia bacterium]
MKKLQLPIHKIVGVLILVGIFCLLPTGIFVKLTELRSWVLLPWQWIYGVPLLIYGGIGAALVLLSADGENVGFRIRKSSLIVGCILLFYVLLLMTCDYISWMRLGKPGFAEEIIETMQKIYNSIELNLVLFRWFGISGKNNYQGAMYHIIYILTGFLITRGLFGNKEK